MRVRLWLGRANAVALKLFLQLGGIGAFTVGPLPGVHYPYPGPDLAPQGPPAGHPERYCTTPPSRVERELWAALGIDVGRTER